MTQAHVTMTRKYSVLYYLLTNFCVTNEIDPSSHGLSWAHIKDKMNTFQKSQD